MFLATFGMSRFWQPCNMLFFLEKSLQYPGVFFTITSVLAFGLLDFKFNLYSNHRQILAFFKIKNDGVYLVCGGPGKPKNIFFLNSRSRIHALAELCSSRVQ
jgi:hypothetical protein